MKNSSLSSWVIATLSAAALGACATKPAAVASYDNLVSAAVASAENDNSQSLRGDFETGDGQHSQFKVRGIEGAKPTFAFCHLMFRAETRLLFCRGSARANGEANAAALASFVASSLPKGYREEPCNPLPHTYCKSWRTASDETPAVIVFADRTTATWYLFEVHKRLAVSEPRTSRR